MVLRRTASGRPHRLQEFHNLAAQEFGLLREISRGRQNLLRAGMSVYVTVDTNEGAADADSEADLDAAPK